MQKISHILTRYGPQRVALTGNDLQKLRNLLYNIYSSTLAITYSDIGISIETISTLAQPYHVSYDAPNSIWYIGYARSVDNPAYIYLGGYSETILVPETIATTDITTAGTYTLCIDITCTMAGTPTIAHTYRWVTAEQMPTIGISGTITLPLCTVKTSVDANDRVSYQTCNHQMGHIVLPMRLM